MHAYEDTASEISRNPFVSYSVVFPQFVPYTENVKNNVMPA